MDLFTFIILAAVLGLVYMFAFRSTKKAAKGGDGTEPDTAGYNPNRSQISDTSRDRFIEDEIEEDLTSVPGIGAGAARELARGDDGGVHTTHQLIGRFLAMRRPGMGQRAHCDAMWYFLRDNGVHAHRSGIVRCLAEKCETMMPNIYRN